MKNSNKSEAYMTYAYEVKAPRKSKATAPKATKTVGGDLRARGGKTNV